MAQRQLLLIAQPRSMPDFAVQSASSCASCRSPARNRREPHTEWISKGKAGVPVELGVKVCIREDQHQFILHHQVMARQTDDQVTLAMVQQAHKLVLDNPPYFRTVLLGYEDTEKVRITVEKERGAKTNRQLGYLFGVVYVEIARHTGYSIDELDAIFKAKYLKKSLKWRGGELQVIPSKADLTSEEMGEFISNVILEAAELGCVIPEPDKEWDTLETSATN